MTGPNDAVTVYLSTDRDRIEFPTGANLSLIHLSTEEGFEGENFPVTTTRETVGRWRAAFAAFEAALVEMGPLAQEAEAAYDAEQARLSAIELAADQAQWKREKEIQEAEELAVDEVEGPRQWRIVSRPISRNRYKRVVHKVTCPSASGYHTASGIRMNVVLAEMAKPPLYAGVPMKPCGRCGREVVEAVRAQGRPVVDLDS